MNKEHHIQDVYIEENFLLPKSAVQVETAVPAFIGYTEKVIFKGIDLHALNKLQPLEINSFLEFEIIFGGAPEPDSVKIELDSNNSVKAINTVEAFFLYYSVKLFFDNGGASCLIVSVGNYTANAGNRVMHQLLAGLASLEKTDAPTLLVIPDTAKLSNAEAGELHAAMLAQSGKLKNRFALLDLVNGSSICTGPNNPVDQFRFHLGMNNLSFGAAYYPWLVTAYSRKAGNDIVLKGIYYKNGIRADDLAELFRSETIDALHNSGLFPEKKIQLRKPAGNSADKRKKSEALAEAIYTCLKEFYDLKNYTDVSSYDNSTSGIHRKFTAERSTFHKLLKRLKEIAVLHHMPLLTTKLGVDFSTLTFSKRPGFIWNRGRSRSISVGRSLKLLAAEAEQLINSFYEELAAIHSNTQESLKFIDPLYYSVVNSFEKQNIIIPPGGAVAGLITMVDRLKGVWKAPANVSLNSVLFPAAEVWQRDQENLNADAAAGKSINAIRAFPGQGNLVWGARTLAGNDNEWRYVNVRRFCIMVEQSVHEAIKPFLFEKNDAVTWQRIKTLVANFLVSLWTQGALNGTKPEHAFYVRAGLGETMTESDIVRGFLKLEIGLAVIRPAEFIILQLSNKMHKS